MLEQYQTLETEVDLENYRKRLYKLKDAFEDMIYAFKSGIQHGVTLPRFSIERLIKACEGMVAHDAASSPFNMPLAKERAFALKNDVNFFEDAIETSVVPAYNMMREFLESDYMVTR